MNCPCAKIFAAGENACTAQKRRGPEGPAGSISVNSPKIENIDFNRPFRKKKDTAYSRVFLFLLTDFHFYLGPVNCPKRKVFAGDENARGPDMQARWLNRPVLYCPPKWGGSNVEREIYNDSCYASCFHRQ